MIENYHCDNCLEKHDHFMKQVSEACIEIECVKCHTITGMLKEDL